MAEPTEIMLLSGNEAVARGAWEAGALIGVGYPGTPSTETLEYFGTFEQVYAEWAPNEKVALEVAIGSSMAGARSLMTTKHVGVNVAADPLFTASYTGVNGGLVILTADDPGQHSSQNEQDSRAYALAARLPMLEPADSAECLEYTKLAFELSEQFDTPVFLRSTVRVAHTKSPVAVSPRQSGGIKEYAKNSPKWVMVPANARKRRKVVDQRELDIQEWACTTDINKVEMQSKSMGVICSGVTYQYVKEALPEASILKLGMAYPLPEKLILDFASQVDELYVIEEIFDFYTRLVKSMGVTLSQPPKPLPIAGELSPIIIRECFGLDVPEVDAYEAELPLRPPTLCTGCPHRLVFYELSRIKALVTGDIGCYTLGSSVPLSAIDSTVCMGASVSMSHGVELVKKYAEEVTGELSRRPVVAVIGDSTFAHSGITSLLGTIYNAGAGTVCILDNRTTAMTGQQGNPCNGITLQNRPSRELDIPTLLSALGVENIHTVDAQNYSDVKAVLKKATKDEADQLSVIIFQSPCVLIHRSKRPTPQVNGNCTHCGTCIRIGCPALGMGDNNIPQFDPATCIGCNQCGQICPFKCISMNREGE